MAFPINATVHTFDATTPLALVSVASPAAVAVDAVSPISDSETWVNSNNAIEAAFVLTGTFAAAPAAAGTVDLYAKLLDLEGTNDSPDPATDYPHTLLGSFPITTLATQTVSLIAPLDNTKLLQNYQFALGNSTNQILNAGWALRVAPRALIQTT